MNTGFYENLDTNFEQACEMSIQDFSHEELLEMLKNGNIPKKQIAALKLDDISNSDEAKILLNNLTGCDGKIRESVALKINQLLHSNKEYISYFTKNSDKVFADASIDINANICRLVIDSVDILRANPVFFDKYKQRILNFIEETFAELDKFMFRDKKYVINKQLFKLYWCLESLKLFALELEEDNLYMLLLRASQEKEYTIREKVAQIVLKQKSIKFDSLKLDLASDENYYVRNVFQ